MKRFLLIFALLIGGSFVSIQPASAGQLCADGWYSPSSGSGSCSWHGGIAGGTSSRLNNYNPAPVYKAPAPVYKTPSIGNSGITGFCSAMDRNKGRCR